MLVAGVALAADRNSDHEAKQKLSGRKCSSAITIVVGFKNTPIDLIDDARAALDKKSILGRFYSR